MGEIKISKLKPEAYFDLEDFMNFSKESRLDAPTLEMLAEYWEDWQGKLQARQIEHDSDSWLAVWLPETIAEAIENTWHSLPSKGFMLNSLAQYLCMSAVGNLLPQVETLGCAPTPAPHASLRKGLQELELATDDGTLANRFAVVTHYPFRGGCEVCNLSEDCPKHAAQEPFASIVLPGYEK